MLRIAIDFECPSPEWWESGGRDLWESLADGFGESSVVLDEGLAKSIMEQAASLPGWEGAGNEYSPHPLRCESADDDEDPPAS